MATDSTPDDPSRSADTASAEVIFLGTGTSVGVPAIGCECHVCKSDDPHNQRTRCAIVVRLGAGNLLIDTPPDLRTQLLREHISLVHAVLYTHEHTDHLYGLDDVRLFPLRLGHAMPLYCERQVEERIRRVYDYAFSDREPTHPGSAPQLAFSRITHEPFEVLGVNVVPIPMRHGPHFNVLGFRIGDFAYCTDTNAIPPDSMERLRGVDTLVMDALRFRPHPTHFCIHEAIEVIQEIKPRRAFLTHLCHDVDHCTVDRGLPAGIHLAYDGLRLTIHP